MHTIVKKILVVAVAVASVFNAPQAFAHGRDRGDHHGWHAHHAWHGGSHYRWSRHVAYHHGVYHVERPVYRIVYREPVRTEIYQSADDGYPMESTIGYRGQNRHCREYQAIATVGGRRQETYGAACLQPDGSWEIVN